MQNHERCITAPVKWQNLPFLLCNYRMFFSTHGVIYLPWIKLFVCTLQDDWRNCTNAGMMKKMVHIAIWKAHKGSVLCSIKPSNVRNVKEYFSVFVCVMDMYVDAWLTPFYVFNDKIICSSDGVCFCCYSWIKLCWNNILWGKHIIIGRIIKLKYPYRTK